MRTNILLILILIIIAACSNSNQINGNVINKISAKHQICIDFCGELSYQLLEYIDTEKMTCLCFDEDNKVLMDIIIGE